MLRKRKREGPRGSAEVHRGAEAARPIAQRAAEVIERNILTVQEIACRLGEHIADTEMLLRSIAEGYFETEEDVPQEEAR